MKNLFSSIFLFVAAIFSTVACDTDSDDLYSHERAFLRVYPVTAVAPLYNALRSPGQWCAITIGTSKYNFSNYQGQTAQLDFTAIVKNYGNPECIAGFVAGTPSLPDLNMQQDPQAYDLACPTCYEQNMLQRNLSFTASEELTCSRCHCIYDLSNGGLLTSGEGTKRLYKYHVTYAEANNLMIIMN